MRRLLLALASVAALTACARRDATPPATTTATAVPAEERWSLYDLPTTWRDQRGATVQLDTFSGRPRVLAMVYTNCQATCPLIVADLKRIEASLPAARRDDVGFVLVSLDPERDTPGRLAAWAAATRLDPARWTLLNGDADAVRALAAAIGVRYQAEGADALAHSNVITVLDADGVMVHQQLGLGTEAQGTIDAVQRALR